MNKNWKHFLAALLAVLMLLSLIPAGMALADAVTPSDLPSEWEEEEDTPAASDVPELLQISVSGPVEVEQRFTVTARLANVTRALLTVDGRVYPTIDSQGLAEEQLAEIMMGISMTVPADGRMTITEIADLTPGKHVVSMLLLVDGKWQKASRSATLTVNGKQAEATNPTGITGNNVIEGTGIYLGKEEIGSYTGSASISRITVGSSIARVSLTSSTTFKIYPQRTGVTNLLVYWRDGTRSNYKLVILPNANAAYSISFNTTGTVTMAIGSTYTLGYTTVPSTASERVSFSSSSTTVATVSSSGVVYPKKEGTTVITATTASGKKATVTVKVTDPYKPTGVSVAQGRSVSMVVGEGKTLTPVLTPSSARATYTWSTSNRSVVTVSSSGYLTALKEGTATITLRTHNGKYTTVTVKVTDPYKPTAVKLSQGTAMNVCVNGTYSLTPVLTPSSARATYTWSSSNSSVATVSSSGYVRVIREGTATITVRTHNGRTATIRLTAVDPHKPKSVEILANGSTVGATLTQSQSKSLQLSAKTVAYGGSSYTVPSSYLTWTSSNASIASISSSGTVTVKRAGTVTFTLTGKGGVKDTLRVTFVRDVTLTSISLTPTSVSLKVGGSQQMTVKTTPTEALSSANLTWWSSRSSIATVSQSGKITGVSAGTCVVYVQDLNTGIYKSVSVTVSEEIHYRAILAVEKTYVEDNGYRGIMTRQTDLDGMKKVLSMQNYGGAKWEITSLHTTSASTVLSTISSVAAKTKPNDVTLFYFMGHGSSDGSIWFWDGSRIKPAELKAALDKNSGKVIVLLGSCYSGSYVTKGMTGSEPGSFTNAVIDAFAVGDMVPSAYVDASGETQIVTEDMLIDENTAKGVSHTPKRGELMTSKYYVLTCAAATEYGWSMYSYHLSGRTMIVDESSSWNVFTRGVTRAGGWDAITKSTLWSSGTRTLSQVYSSVYSWCKNNSGTSSTVQVYPANSSFILFQK